MKPSSSSCGLRGLVVAGTFLFLAPSPGVVSAADLSSASRTVKFADLNVASSSGAHVLYMRILAASQAVCSDYPFATDGDKARCVRDAIAAAVTKIDQPELSAVYNANYKVRVPIHLVSRDR